MAEKKASAEKKVVKKTVAKPAKVVAAKKVATSAPKKVPVKKVAVKKDIVENTVVMQVKKQGEKKVVAETPAERVEVAATKEVGDKKKASTSSLRIDVHDVSGKVSGSIDLPKEIFGAKVNKQLLAQAV